MNSPIYLYRTPKSGHCHRVELMLSLLNLPYVTKDVDMANGDHKKAEFLKLSPFGLVPAIQDGGYSLSDSNAILVYLVQTYAKDSNWIPQSPVEAAEVQRWLSIAADNIYAGPCAARLVKVFNVPLDHDIAVSKAHSLLKIMEEHLKNRSWLATDKVTIADIAGYSYIAHAPEGGVDLAPYPSVLAWLKRIEALPNFIAMAKSPLSELS